jgi:hypothetical protein
VSKVTRCDGCGKDIDGSGRTWHLASLIDWDETTTQLDFCSLPCITAWSEDRHRKETKEQ